jgi:hypothetical protein
VVLLSGQTRDTSEEPPVILFQSSHEIENNGFCLHKSAGHQKDVKQSWGSHYI